MAFYTVRQNQNIYDVVVQNYGDIEQVFKFLTDNQFDFNTVLQAGQRVIIEPQGLGDENVKVAFQKVSQVLANGPTLVISTVDNQLLVDQEGITVDQTDITADQTEI